MKNKLRDLVYNYKTKYKEGFIDSEIAELLAKFPNINMDRYYDAMMGNTCMLIGTDVIRYHCDILVGLCCGLENRGITTFEFD
jgi:hypothetical protein